MKRISKITLAAILLASTTYAAEPEKALPELVQERQSVMVEIESYHKENEKNVAAFNKLPAVIEFNAKQELLNAKWQKANARAQEINSKIADKVAKEKK
jgi:hypothetical protein